MGLTLLLYCTDISKTREFYRSVLNFNVTNTAKGTVTVEKYGGKLIFTDRPLWKNAPNFSGTIYFTVMDAEAAFASLKDSTTVLWPLQDMVYGSREFAVHDCNGYSLAFQQHRNQP